MRSLVTSECIDWRRYPRERKRESELLLPYHCRLTRAEMSVEVIPIEQLSFDSITMLSSSSLSENSAESESDGGYGTPAEHFADDEIDRPLTPPESSTPVRTAAAPSTASDGIVVVDPELQQRILKQVEYYFGDENLLKDSFLMKHINRNKQGYVSLKLVASFRKVKSLTKDWRVVLTSVRQSTFLALNEEETKIRRTSPPPEVDYSHVAKTVIITNYPDEEPNVTSIEETFGKYGEVTLVRILHPGKAVPLDVKPCRAKHPNLGKELCILVEYESEEGARIACGRFREQQSWRDSMKVELLDRKVEVKEPNHTQEIEKTSKNSTNTEQGKSRRKQKSNKKSSDSKLELNHHGASAAWRAFRENSPGRFSKENSPSPRHSREESPVIRKHAWNASPDLHQRRKLGKGTPEVQRKFLHPEAWKDYASDSGYSARSPSQSPNTSHEPLKKFFSGEIAPSWRSSEKHVHVKSSCVIRQPLGPDDTKGFLRHRRPIRISVESC